MKKRKTPFKEKAAGSGLTSGWMKKSPGGR